jgi:hypothetical protein
MQTAPLRFPNSPGLAFLEQVGYQLSDADITGLGLLMVVRDPKTLEKGKFKKGYYGKLLVSGAPIWSLARMAGAREHPLRGPNRVRPGTMAPRMNPG